MTFSGIRHRLLLSLALAPGLTVRELAAVLGVSSVSSVSTAHHHIKALREAGLVEQVTRGPVRSGYRLRPGVVVSEKGFVGRVVEPCTVFGDGVPAGMWVRERKPLPSTSPQLVRSRG